MRAHRRGSRRRPVFVWIIVIAALAAAAVMAGRTFRPLLPARGPAGAPRTDVQVFFVRAAAGGRALTLAPVRRRVAEAPAEAIAASALRALLDGPTRSERSRGLLTEIPAGTALRGVTLRGGIATVDLGVQFAQGGGSSSILARVWQVVYTASQFPGASSVQILIGGRRVDTLGGEGLLIGAPLRRPPSIPTF